MSGPLGEAACGLLGLGVGAVGVDLGVGGSGVGLAIAAPATIVVAVVTAMIERRSSTVMFESSGTYLSLIHI